MYKRLEMAVHILNQREILFRETQNEEDDV